MNKAVLVIDMPEHCDDCPFRVLWAKYHCVVNGKFCGDEQGFYSSLTKPSWCPLRLYQETIPIEWINSYTTGLIFSDEYIDNTDSIDYYIDCIKEMVRDWEKENE